MHTLFIFLSIFILGSHSQTINANYQTWATSNADAPWLPRHAHSLVVAGDSAYIIAGERNAIGTTTVHTYSDVWVSSVSAPGTWTQVDIKTPYPGRYDHGCVVLNNTIILIAGDYLNGTVSTSLNDVWASSDGGVNWNQLTSNAGFTPRKALMVSVVGNTIVLVGGLLELPNGTHIHGSDVWNSNDGGVTWFEVAANETFGPRADAVMVTVNGSLLLMGGEIGPPITYDDVWRSDDAGATWTEVTSEAPWQNRFQFAGAVIDGVVVISGGHHTNFTFDYNDVWASADIGKTWSLITNNATWSPRSHHAMETLPNNAGMLVAGGSNPKNDTNDVFYAQGLVFVSTTTGSTTGATTGTTSAANVLSLMWMLVTAMIVVLF